MFIDVCIPKNNEKEFVEIARKLDIKGLCFIDSKESVNDFKIYNGSFKKGKLVFEPIKKNIANKKRVYYYAKNKSKSFHYPSILTQVTIKKIKESKSIILVPLHEIKEDNIEEISFLISISNKYKVNLGFASFASSPYELRQEKDIVGLAKILGMKTEQIRDSLSCLEKFCSGIFL